MRLKTPPLSTLFCIALILVIVACTTSGRTIAQSVTYDRVVIGTSLPAQILLAKRHRLLILGVEPALSAIHVRAQSKRQVKGFDAHCYQVPFVTSLEEIEPLGAVRISGPSSVPLINPAGSPAQILSQPSMSGFAQAFQPSSALLGLPLATIRVAIIDTGADLAHPTLANSIDVDSYDFINPGTTPDDTFDGVDNDGDGVVDSAWGHGTHLAGIIATACPSASLMILRAINDEGAGDTWLLSQAIVHAVAKGADVINLSMGMRVGSPLVSAAIAQAVAAGIPVITSAGNDTSSTPVFPSGLSGVITIGATEVTLSNPFGWFQLPLYIPGWTTSIETIAPYSNYGFVNYACEGSDILSTFPGGTYATWSGTSAASAHAAATIALMLSINPSLDLAGIQSILTSTAVDVMSGHPLGAQALGDGRIDDLGAVIQAIWSLI